MDGILDQAAGHGKEKARCPHRAPTTVTTVDQQVLGVKLGQNVLKLRLPLQILDICRALMVLLVHGVCSVVVPKNKNRKLYISNVVLSPI